MEETRYQVFVSSTFTDLKEEREKVLQAILQLRAFPAGMELFPAADEDQFEFIKREIDSSDYYVVIIAGRYGSLADDGLSFTEKEYDYARSIGKPTFAFLARDLGKLIGDRLESGEDAKRKLAEFTDKAKKSKLVRFYSNSDELKAEVLHSLPSQFNLKPMRGWVRSGQTSREDLKRIASLQERVLDLERENTQLLRAQVDIRDELSHGSELIRWTVDLSDVRLNDQRSPVLSPYEYVNSWDELFTLIFSGDRSDIEQEDVRRTLGLAVLDAAPENCIDLAWRHELARKIEIDKWFVSWGAVLTMAKDVHRQFTGLGLIQDHVETRYVKEMYGTQLSPKTVRVWKLTDKGGIHLAAISGYRRNRS